MSAIPESHVTVDSLRCSSGKVLLFRPYQGPYAQYLPLVTHAAIDDAINRTE